MNPIALYASAAICSDAGAYVPTFLDRLLAVLGVRRG